MKIFKLLKERNKKGRLTQSDLFFIFGVIIFLLGILVGIVYLFGVDLTLNTWRCPLKMLTGISCPGCGGTRALRALLRFDIIESVKMNPAVLYLAVLYILFMVKYILSHYFNITPLKYRKIYIIFLGILMGLNFINRNFLM